MNKMTLLLCSMMIAGPAFGQMYEWRDPATGRLQLGDKPPSGGIEYWEEGKRPDPNAKPIHEPTQTGTDPGVAAQRLRANRESAFKNMIALAGYRCDSIDAIHPFLLSEGYTVYCNNNRYRYEIEDRGGRAIVTVK